MRKFKLCAAMMAMVMTGAAAFPSQAGFGTMVIGGNCSAGQSYGTNGRTGNTGGWGYGSNGNSLNTGGWNSGSSGNSCSTNGWSSGSNGNNCGTNGWNNSSNGNSCNTGNILPEIVFGNNWAGINGSLSSSCPIGTIISGSGNANGNCFTGSNSGGNQDCLEPACPEGTLQSQCKPNACVPGTTKPESKPSEETKPAPDDAEETKPDTGNGAETKPDTGNSGETSSGENHTTGGGSGITRPDGSQTGGNTAEDDLPQEDSQTRTYIRQVIALVNEERAKAGLSPVTESAKAAEAAALRAQEITRSFSHTRPDGTSFSTALRQSGVSFSGSGENIAYGQPSAKAVMDTWMNSPTHRANILNRQFTNIGVGCYIDSRGTIYWTQLFTY